MLNTSTRPCTAEELQAYSDGLGGWPLSAPACAAFAIVFGSVVTLGVFVLVWVAALFTSGTASWTWPLGAGAAAAVLGFVALRFALRAYDWKGGLPGPATDVSGTADAAWMIDDDSPWYRLVLRCGPDCYLVVNQSIWLPPFGGAEFEDEIGAEFTLVLLGASPNRRVLRSAVSGHEIAVTKIEIYPWADENADPGANRRIDDGFYTAAELPTAIREVVRPG